MNIVILDGRKMTDKDSTHLYLQKTLNLPDYYGKNLDALYDCLCEMGKPVQIIVSYVQEMQGNLRRYADSLLNTLEAASEKNFNVSVIIEELVDEL